MKIELYFRYEPPSPPQAMFIEREDFSAEIEQMLLSQIAQHTDQPGIYRTSFQQDQENPELQLEKIAESDASLGLIHIAKSSNGKIKIKSAYLDTTKSKDLQELQKSLAIIAANHAQTLPKDSHTWLAIEVGTSPSTQNLET